MVLPKYIQTLLQKYVPNLGVNLASGYLLTFSLMGVNILFAPFYLLYLDIAEFGLLMFLMSLVNFAAIGIGWASGGLVRMLGEAWANNNLVDFQNIHAMGRVVFVAYAIVASVLCLFGWAILNYFDVVSQSVPLEVWCAMIYMLLHYEQVPDRQVMNAMNRIYLGNYVEIGRVAIFVLAVLICLPIFQSVVSVWLCFVASIVVQKLFYLICWSYLKIQFTYRRFALDSKHLQRLIGGLGLRFGIYGMLNLFLLSDVMFVGLFLGMDAAGIFVLVWKIPEAIAILIWRVPAVLEPRIVLLHKKDEIHDINKIYHKGYVIYSMICVFAGLSYMLFGKWLVTLWVNDNAPIDASLYYLAGVALSFMTITRWPMSFASSLLQFRHLTMTLFSEAVLKILLLLLLTESYGIKAALIAIIASKLIYPVFGYHLSISKFLRLHTK